MPKSLINDADLPSNALCDIYLRASSSEVLLNHKHVFGDYTSKINTTFPRDQWVNPGAGSWNSLDALWLTCEVQYADFVSFTLE